MNGRLLLLVVALGVVGVCLLVGDDLIDPVRGLWGGDADRTEDEAGLLTADGTEENPRLEGRGRPPSATKDAPPPEIERPRKRERLRTRFRGVVRGVGGRPVGGVRVKLVGPAGTFEVTTDGKGGFDQKVPVGVYRAVFEAPGEGALVVPALVVDGTGESAEPQTFELESYVEFDVLVRRTQEGDGEPAPAPGLTVVLRNTIASEFTREALTGGEGVAMFSEVLPQPHEILVQVDEQTLAKKPLEVQEGQGTVELRLPDLVTIRGRVTAKEGGRGIGDAVVTVSVEARAGETRYQSTLVTGFDGVLEGSVPRGKGLSLGIRAEGFARWPFDGPSQLAASRALHRLRSTKTVELNAALVPGVGIRGRFLPAEGESLPSDGLAFELTSGSQKASGRSDASGQFEVPSLLPGGFRLELRTPGWTTRNPRIGLRDSHAPVLDVGDIEVRRPPSLQGSVKDSGGRGVAGARVRVTGLAEGQLTTRSAFTDASGRWELVDPPASASWTIRASLGTRSSEPVTWYATSPQPLELVLVDTVVLTGRVQEVDDGPGVSGVTIELIPQGLGTRETSRTQTRDDGSFQLEGLLPAPYVLRVLAVGYRPVPQRNLRLTNDGKPAEVTVELDPGIVFAGRCVDEAGQPVAGVRVYASGKNSAGRVVGTRVVDTAEDGTFRMGGLEEATWRLRCFRSGYKDANRTGLTRGDERIEITLVPRTR